MNKLLSMLIAVVLAAPLMASAADNKAGADKNPCAVNSENCSGQTYSIQQIMSKLQTELNKGTSVYTAAELKRLEAKLNGYQFLSTTLTTN